MDALNPSEIKILQWIQDTFKCGFMDFIMPKITMFAEAGIGWILLAVILVCFKKTRKSGIMMGVAMILGLSIGNGIVKNIIARTRPYNVEIGFKSIMASLNIKELTDYSFPSGHTLASFEACTVLMIMHRKTLGWASLVLAVLIAFSRMYVLVHYPTDILGGVILGAIFAVAGYFIVQFVYKKFVYKNSISEIKD